jgi:pimeloyl-ACP methyl ester carboxylesterase
VLFAPFWNLNHVLWQLLPALKYIFPTIRPFGLMKMDFSNPEVRDGIHNFMPGADLDNPQVQQAIRELQIPVGVFDQIRTAGQKAYQSAPNLDVPTLVFQGSEDDLVRPEMTQQLVQRMKGQVIYTQVQGKHNLLDPHSSVWPKIENAVLEFTRKLL